MYEAASVFLRAELQQKDGLQLAAWMRNPNVTRYLNEKGDVSDELIALMERTPEGMLSYHLNQSGRFFLVCSRERGSIGFVRLMPNSDRCSEIVYVIGEELLWGHGYGRHALDLALAKAFFELRRETVIARIKKENVRSIRTALRCGMRLVRKTGRLQTYQITAREYMEHRNRTR